MIVIAYFNLKKETNLKEFCHWVLTKQTKVFAKYLPKMKNFKDFVVRETANFPGSPQIVQVFDWDGTAEDWRETMRKFASSENPDLHATLLEWNKMCDGKSVLLSYADSVENHI